MQEDKEESVKVVNEEGGKEDQEMNSEQNQNNPEMAEQESKQENEAMKDENKDDQKNIQGEQVKDNEKKEDQKIESKAIKVEGDKEEEGEGAKGRVRGFAGLGNQGATCYMNSLLQALYMSPEFRLMVYRWQYDEDRNPARKDCIIYQLQKLFATLQIIQANREEEDNEKAQASKAPAKGGPDADSTPEGIEWGGTQKTSSVYGWAETTGLTGSFQWDYREAMQQHDVQEFCMQLFDAVEQSFEQSGTYGVIAELYQGEKRDYVKCLKCNYESPREAKFFDLQLVVQNQFENIQNSSIEQALQGFLQVEKLEGANQYACPECDEKQDAEKGTKFVKLPKILMLQLQRFTLDFQTMNRKKLNDPVSFPLLLDMNHFLDKETLNDPKAYAELVAGNPLDEVKTMMAPAKTFKQEHKEMKEEAIARNDKERAFAEQMQAEVGDTVMVDEATGGEMGKGARARMERKKKEQEEHKKRLAALKTTQAARKKAAGTKAARPKFGGSGPNTAFMNNAKKPKDEVHGWALDFDNEAQNVAVPTRPRGGAGTEDEQMQMALAASLQENNDAKTTASNAEAEPQNLQNQSKDKENSKIESNANQSTDKQDKGDQNESQANNSEDKKPKVSQKEMEKYILDKNVELKKKYLQQGPFVYELYGIMLHSGGAYGGHYSAYIKDFDRDGPSAAADDCWYHFNDSHVQKIPMTELANAFGRAQGPSSRRFAANHANAYMLMYRLVQDENDEIRQIELDEIAEEMQAEVLKGAQQQQVITIAAIERKQKMQLKVVHVKMKEGGDNCDDFEEVDASGKIVLVDRKVDTYLTLKELVLREFFGTDRGDIDENLFRLRAFNVQFRILLDTYTGREDLSLEQLKIYPMKTIALEERQSVDVEWKPYDPASMQIKLTFWKPDIIRTHHSVAEYAEQTWRKILIPREMTMAELKTYVQTKFEMGQAVIMKRTPMMQNQAVEILSSPDSKLEKGLNELRVSEGINLYIEDAAEKYSSSDQTAQTNSEEAESFATKWELEFELELNRYTIKYNKLAEAQRSQQAAQYSESAVIDRRATVEQLKLQIASQLGESLDNIIFRRGGSHGAELVEDDLGMRVAHVYDRMSVYVERGEPTRQGWKRVRFFVAEYYNPDWQNYEALIKAISEEGKDAAPEVLREPHDHEFFTFTELAKVAVRTLDTVAAIKTAVAAKLIELSDSIPQLSDAHKLLLQDPQNFRLREKLSEKLAQAYHSDKILSSYSMHDDKEISIQFLAETDKQYESTSDNLLRQHLVMVKLWHTDACTLDLPVEIWLDKDAGLADFAAQLSQRFNIAADQIMCTKINSPWNFHRVELPFVEWVHLTREDIGQNVISSNPFYLSTDGILFIIRDSKTEIRDMTAEEKDLYRCEEFEGQMFAAGGTGAGKGVARRAEVGVKITVMHHQHDEDQKPNDDQV